MSMEASPAPVYEILSLRQAASGGRMKVRIDTNIPGEMCQREIEIDGFTYLQLAALPLFQERSRIRMSLTCKWDPFRRGYFSTVAKLSGDLVETLYFACSEQYLSLLNELRQGILVEKREQPKDLEGKGLHSGHREEPSRFRPISCPGSVLKHLARVAFIFVVLLLAMMHVSGEPLMEDADALVTFQSGSGSSRGLTAPMNLSIPALIPNLPLPMPSPVNSTLSDPATVNDRTEPSNVDVHPIGSIESSGKEVQPLDDKQALSPVKRISLDADVAYALPKGYVALTFDDGPSKYTKDIVDILVKEQVAATFLFVGANAAKLQEEVTYAGKQGMSVGSHSWNHRRLTQVSAEEQKKDLEKASKVLEKLTGLPVTVFRPPYGAMNEELEQAAVESDMKVLLWNRDPKDWSATTKEEILDYFLTTDPSGGIYVMHENKLTVETLPEIIAYLKKQRLSFAVY